MHKRTIALIALTGFGLAGSLPTRADKVDDYIQAQMEKRHIPGVSVGVIQNCKVVLAKGYGYANVENSVLATADTVYELASVTKQFTATGIMRLVEDGKIGLDDALGKHLSDVPAVWRPVTIRQLLTHTSGIKNYTAVDGFDKTERKDFTHDELLKLVADAPLDFAPGSKHSYSNTGYFLLGMIIEKESGQSYGDYLKQQIFAPLGMTNTRVNDMQAIIKNRASGYTIKQNTLQNAEYVSPTQPYAAGALVSSIRDLIKWNMALDNAQLLKRGGWEQMWMPVKLTDGKTADYGFGWGLGTYRTRKRISHGGGIPGFSTNISRYPDDKTAVIVLTNSDGGGGDALADGIAALYIPALAANAPRPIADSDPQTTARLRTLLADIANGKSKAHESEFAPESWKVLSPRFEETKGIPGVTGSLTEFTLMGEQTGNGRRVRIYRVVFGDTTMEAVFALNSDAKIIGIGLHRDQ